MLKQNLQDKCFTMANIFSFAEKIIPDFKKKSEAEKIILDFKKKSEGDKFLFLYCITAKLLSNRLYDYETAEDKIKCLLSRIPKDKKENAEQLTELLKIFIGENDFSVDKVKSFFEINKSLLGEIYGNEKPADLLLFFAQMQSKEIFKKENNETFVNGIENSKVEQENLLQHRMDCSTGGFGNEYSMYELNGQAVHCHKILQALKKDPNRIFNDYIDKLDKNMKLEIFDVQGNEYKTKSFKLNNRTCSHDYGEYYKIENKQVDCGYAYADIDEILKEKFNFKTINELSKDKLETLNLNYSEEFIYFLASEDFSNERFLQDGGYFSTFYDFELPEQIKPETTLKIFYYFGQLKDSKLAYRGVDYLRDKFETSQSLLDICNKLNLPGNKLLELFIGNPPKVKQVLKCQDTKSTEEIDALLNRCDFTNIIDYFTDNDKDQAVLSGYILQYPEKLCSNLEYIWNKLDNLKQNQNQANNDSKLKRLQNLMISFFALKNVDKLLDECDFADIINYFLNRDEGKELLLKYMYNNVKRLEDSFEEMLKVWKKLKNNKNKTEQYNTTLKKLEYLITKFLLACKKQVFADDKKYIAMIIDMFESQKKFHMYNLNSEEGTDVTGTLEKLLNDLINQNLGLVDNKSDIKMLESSSEKKESSQLIVERNGKSYDLAKIYFCPSETTIYENSYSTDKYVGGDPGKDLQEKIKVYKKILDSEVVPDETKQMIYFIATKYKEYLVKTYNDLEELLKNKFYNTLDDFFKIFLDYLKIDRETYDCLEKANKDEMINRKDYLLKKSNVTDFYSFNENWKTWLSFILIVPIFLYYFVWKPQYENEIKALKSDLDKLEQITMFKEQKVNAERDYYDHLYTFKFHVDSFQSFIGNEPCFKKSIDLYSYRYKYLSSGQYHQIVKDEIGKFIEKYEKIFEPEKTKQRNIVSGLEPKSEIEEINTDKNDISTNK